MIQRYSGIPRGCGTVLVAQQQLGEIMAQRPDPQNHQINRGWAPLKCRTAFELCQIHFVLMKR